MIGITKLKELKKAMEAKVKTNRYFKFEVALRDAARRLCWGRLETEFRFYSLRKWRADYAFEDAKLIIEIEGGFWSGGRHGRGGGAIKDMEKYNWANVMGYHVLRFTPQQANNLKAIEEIALWFDSRNLRMEHAIEKQHSFEEQLRAAIERKNG